MPVQWSPSVLRMQSGISRLQANTRSFLKPAGAFGDTGQIATALHHAWNNAAVLEFRPVPLFSARVNARQLFDLRNYGDAPATLDSVDRRAAARAEQRRLLGVGIGMERERSLTTGIELLPVRIGWVRPRASFETGFAMVKDPNARTLLRVEDSLGAFRLPRRAGATQQFATGVLVDVPQLMSRNGAPTSWWHRVVQPLDVSWSRALDSDYDNTATIPRGGYQWGIGGLDLFRGVDGQVATAAGRVQRLIVSSGFTLPLSFAVSTRAEVGRIDTWSRRARDGSQIRLLNAQDVYPDITVRWNWRPVRPVGVLAGVAATAGYAVNAQRSEAPDGFGGYADRTRGEALRLPLSAAVTWELFGPLTTSAMWSRTTRADTRPGSRTDSWSDDLTLGVGRTFALPSTWKQRSGLRTQLLWQRQGAQSVVRDDRALSTLAGGSASPFRSVLADNGREGFTLNADTDVSESLTFSLAASHVVTFDRSFNRRFVQTTFSAILQLHFFNVIAR
jgi:hypothetical protein